MLENSIDILLFRSPTHWVYIHLVFEYKKRQHFFVSHPQDFFMPYFLEEKFYIYKSKWYTIGIYPMVIVNLFLYKTVRLRERKLKRFEEIKSVKLQGKSVLQGTQPTWIKFHNGKYSFFLDNDKSQSDNADRNKCRWESAVLLTKHRFFHSAIV